MEVIETSRRMREKSRQLKREGRKIGFVPTMGYLHQAHLALIRAARKASDAVVVSIFVNPAQFGPAEDLDRYPRAPERDLRLCREVGVDVVFMPPISEIYPRSFSTFVEETALSRPLCGAARPGHFRGVATVVAKLFNLVGPDLAFFGAKDWQQSRVVARMVRDLAFPLKVEVLPTVREKDGLAASSRNRNLKGAARSDALCLYRSLKLARKLAAKGECSARAIREAMARLIARHSRARVDYIGIFDEATLRPQRRINRRSRAALAVFIGGVRLIDNMKIGPPK